MMEHLLIAFVMAFASLGVWVAYGPGMAFEFVGKFIERRAPKFLRKPLATCPRCMVTVYGTAAVVLLGMTPPDIRDAMVSLARCAPVSADVAPLAAWPIYLLCAAGIQELLSR